VYPDKTSPYFVHIHASCARVGGEVVGGGLVKGRAFRALRVFLTPVNT
jgi:predicted DNA-binding protein with PD1-like motif